MNLLYNVRNVPSALLNAANVEQDVLCRIFGRCTYGGPIDAEFGALVNVHEGDPTYWPKRFTYVRYNPELTQPAIDALGLPDLKADAVQPLLSSTNVVGPLSRLGDAYANLATRPDHFGSHWPGYQTIPRRA